MRPMDFEIIIGAILSILSIVAIVGGFVTWMKKETLAEMERCRNRHNERSGLIVCRIDESIDNLKESVGANHKELKEDISRLEKKQDRHNHVVERLAVVEQSAKSAHHRIDDFKEEEKK